MKKNLFFVLIVSLLLLVSCSGNGSDKDQGPGTDYTVGIIADVHNGAGKFNTALENIINHAGGLEELDGVVLVGDILYTSETATPNYDFLTSSEKFNEIKDAGKLMYTMGNHEYPLNATLSKAPEKVEAAQALFTEKTGEPLEEDTVIGGFHFITVSSADYSNALTLEQEQYIMDRANAALAESKSKPVFIFFHQTVDGTLNGSLNSDKQSTEFEEFIKNEPRFVVISAHTHYTLSDPHSIYQVPGGATFLYTSVVSTSVGQNMSYANVDHREYSSQGIMLSVNDKTNVVTLKRFYVDEKNPAFLEGGDWVFDIPAMIAESKKEEPSLDVYQYTNAREQLSMAPSFDAGCEISVTEISDTSVDFTFPNATPAKEDDNNYVGYYKIEIFNGVTGELLQSNKIISDFFILKKLDTVKHSFYGLPYCEKWKISVTPVSTWYVEGEPITLEAVPPKPEFEPIDVDEGAVYEAPIKDMTAVGISGHYTKAEDSITIRAAGSATVRYNFETEKAGTYRLVITASADKGTEATVSVTHRTDEGDVVIYESARKFGTGSIDTPKEFITCDFEAPEKGTYIVKLKKSNTETPLRIYGMKLLRHSQGVVYDLIGGEPEKKSAGGMLITPNSIIPWNNPKNITRAELAWASDRMGERLSTLQKACEEVGGKLMYVGIPEQHSMLREDYPEGYEDDGEYLDMIEEEFFRELDERGIMYIDMMPIFKTENYRSYYSPYDHHYTLDGAIRTYQEIKKKLEGLGLAQGMLNVEDFTRITLENPFMGSRARSVKSAYYLTSTISRLEPKVPVEFERYQSGVKYNWIDFKPAKTTTEIGYYLYMGGDNAETLVKTNRPELPDIMIIGDSFTNPLESMLYTGFDSMLSVDLRHNEKSVYDYIKEFEPDIVLVIRDDTCYLSFDGNGNY